MSGMFDACSKMESYDKIKTFNTEKVTNMSTMFRNNTTLPTIDLTGWKVPALTDASSMFTGCTQLQSIV